jgi:hypothetical protein
MRARGLISISASFVVVAIAAACGVNQSSQDSFEQAAGGAAAPAPAPHKALADEAQRFSVTGHAAGADAVTRVQQTRDSVAPSMIIRNGSAMIQVEDLEPALEAIRRLSQQLGGYIANTSVTTGRDQVPSGTIELKIPAARYDSALAGLQPLGKVESVNTTAEDVGEEFVDVSARLANARRLEDRIVVLLATRTGKLEDVIAAERELARVREEIERFEGRLRFLRTRVALSTLAVTIHEPYPVVGGPGVGPIAESFKQMWRNFVNFVAWLIASLGWLIPLSALALLVGLGVRKYVWKRRLAPTAQTS